MPIHFTCPACNQTISVHDNAAGAKGACPGCGQRVQAPMPDRNKTVLGKPLDQIPFATVATQQPPAPVPQPAPYPIPIPEPVRERRPRSGFRCVYCQTTEPPITYSKISTAGWIVFVILLLFCFPLCFIALFITEPHKRCGECGIMLD